MSVPPDAGDYLLPLARTTIGERLGVAGRPPAPPAWAQADGAAFVTLHRDGRLRGCIGSLEAYRPLHHDVTENAVAAAFRDPRFAPVERRELEGLVIEVSVLSTPEPMPVGSEAELVAALRPHVDGVLLQAPGHRGTYLPQVWEQLPDPHDFVRSLKAKARLPQDYWSDDIRISRYTVTAWEES